MRPFSWGRSRDERFGLIGGLAGVWRREGDEIVAITAAVLNTSFIECRRTPIGLLLRMYRHAARIAKLRKG